MFNILLPTVPLTVALIASFVATKYIQYVVVGIDSQYTK